MVNGEHRAIGIIESAVKWSSVVLRGASFFSVRTFGLRGRLGECNGISCRQFSVGSYISPLQGIRGKMGRGHDAVRPTKSGDWQLNPALGCYS